MNARNPHDLNQIRPSAELDHSHARPPGGRRPRGQYRTQRMPRPPRKGWSLWAKLAAGLFGLIAVIGVGIGGLLYVMSPAELLRSELIRQVKANTGRDLRINGRAGLLFYPDIGVSLGNVELSGPPGMAGGPLLTAKRVNLRVALLPLLSRKVRVEHVGLVNPRIDLVVDRKGRQNWQFAAFQSPLVRVAALGFDPGYLNDALPRSPVVPTALPAAGGSGVLDQLELRSVALSKANIHYRDDRTGIAHQIDHLDVQLNGRRLSDPLKAKGGLVWQNERLTFDARLDTPSQIIAGRAANARITVAGRPLTAGFDGTVKLGDAIEVAGQTRLNGDSLATATRWLGMEFPNAAPLGGFQVTGRLVGSPKSVALNGAAISLGQTRANGVVLIAFRPKRPYLSADLKISEIDIDRLSAGFAGGLAAPRSTRHPVVENSVPATKQGTPQSIEDLLRRSHMPDRPSGAGRFAPQVRGYTNRNEWSSDAIDAAALGLIDAKARLRIDGLRIAGLTIGRTVARVALADTSARIDIDDVQLYGGGGKGVITASPNRDGVGFGANLRVDKVVARALLKDAVGFERLDGSGNLAVIVSGAGASQKAIANNLNGTATFTFADGAIVGWNLAKIMRGLQKGQFSNFEAIPGEKTDFSELSASFTITRGNATTTDLRMISPLLRLAGQGDIGIGARNLNLSLRPKLVTSLQVQGAAGGAAGLEIPVKLKGPWHDPRIAPDFGGISKDPTQLLSQAEKLGKQFKGKSVGEIVRGVLGDKKQGDAEGGSKPADLLKQFLR